jgi:PAS domain S-box-containing protein
MHPLPANEDIRLAALWRLKILDTPREKGYDDLVDLAAQLLDAPIAAVSLIDRDRQWFKSCVGLSVGGTSRDVSFCSHAIAQDDLDEPLVVTDATGDDRFRSNPLVSGPPHIRMYVGVPLVTREGHALGALCVIDTRPRTPTPQQVKALKTLARSVVSLISLRQAADDLREMEERNRLIVDTAIDGVLTIDAADTVASWNAAAGRLFGCEESEAVGRPVSDLFQPETLEAAAEHPLGVVAGTSDGRRVQRLAVRSDGTMLPVEVTTSTLQTRDGPVYSAFVRDLSDRRRQEKSDRETATRDVAIFTLAKLAEHRDPETGAHLERVQTYCLALARQLQAGGGVGPLDEGFVRLLHLTAPLHDIGKVGVPDAILRKPGPLTAAEFEVMKTHTTIGARTLDAALRRFPDTPFLTMARDIAAAHHERFDGTGYPCGLRGTDIPLAARIVAVADVYDALTSERVYKKAVTHDVARGVLLRGAGNHFDPAVVDAFLACEAAFRTISEARKTTRPAARAA